MPAGRRRSSSNGKIRAAPSCDRIKGKNHFEFISETSNQYLLNIRSFLFPNEYNLN